MPKKKNKSSSKSFLTTRKRTLTLWITVLGTGAVGTYLLASSNAESGEPYPGMDVHVTSLHATNEAPIGSMFTGSIKIQALQGSPERYKTPAFQVVNILSYDTNVVRLVSGNCEWQYGCRVSSYDLATNKEPWHNNELHKKRLAICFNIPANANMYASKAFTYTFQRLDTERSRYLLANNGNNWDVTMSGYAEGTCKSNPSALGLSIKSAHGACADNGYICDNGTGPGKGSGTLTGMEGPGPGTGPGNGTGDGGSGIGTNGSGQGQSPGTGTSGGGGGSTSNKPDDTPNPLPSLTGQGDTNKQPEVEPSPFFDGKQFAIGSDVDTEDIRGVSIAGRTFGLGWVYLLGLLIILGIGGWFGWKKLDPKIKARLKIKLRK